MIKLGFSTNPEDGWPPFEVEHIWLELISGGGYIVHNTPFYIYGMCFGDEIEVISRDGLYVDSWSIVKESRNSTIWVMELKSGAFKSHLKRIAALGVMVDQGVPDGYYAVMIPENVSLRGFEEIVRQDVEEKSISVAYVTVRHLD